MPSDPKQQPPSNPTQPTNRWTGLYFFIAMTVLLAIQLLAPRTPSREVSYNEFTQLLQDGRIDKAQIGPERITAELKPEAGESDAKAQPDLVYTSRLPNIDESQLINEFEHHSVVFSGKVATVSWWQQLLFSWLIPISILIGLYWLLMRYVGRSGSSPLNFGKTRAKIYDRNQDQRVTFADVAGVDEAKAELIEIVGFLKDPRKFQNLGARAPKGVLLVGPPGTGKTLLAQAVAGEANVPFFSISGSEFVEMFVGVGASRMRDMFNQAKERAPGIIFIDELDAIGRSRGGIGSFATHDEREQTLNQLLVEMDGFEGGKGVVIMAATNRPEVLDPALLRAGRFDRQVVVDRPDLRGREEILRVHAKKILLDTSIDLTIVARRTPGMVGADLENIVNEAALAAARRNGRTVTMQDFEEAIDRIQLGLKQRGKIMKPEEKRRVAFHEGGHALVALSVAHADPVHRVTIIPRSVGALGATLQLPTEDRYLMTREELQDRICVLFGGRVAEELVFNDISTGAENDIERATEMARQMVCRYGMSKKLGALTYDPSPSARFLRGPFAIDGEHAFSEETARLIDSEIRSLMDNQHRRAREVLDARRPLLDRIAKELLEKETLEREELEEIERQLREESALVPVVGATR